MPTPVNSYLYQQLYSLCQTGGVIVDPTTQFTYFKKGRMHRVYLVQMGNSQFVIQRLNPLVIRHPPALVNLINSVLAPASLAPQLMLWPATGGYVLYADNAHWIQRPYIEGNTLSNVLSISQFRSMARTIRHFHQTVSIHELDQVSFASVNPWSGEATYALQGLLDNDINLTNDERKIVDHWKQCKQASIDTDLPSNRPPVVVHRDTKSSNFIQRPDGALVLIDFDTIGTGDAAMDLGEILRAWLSSDESHTEVVSAHDGSSDMSHECHPETRRLSINSSDCAQALGALTTGYNDSNMTGSRIRHAAMQCCLWQCERFLQDHFIGNAYYKVDTHGDNLFRAEQQLDALRLLGDTAGLPSDLSIT